MFSYRSYIRSSGKRNYSSLIQHIQKRAQSFEVIRLGLLMLWFLINMGVYLVFINLSATAGYFYSQAQDELEDREFDYNITTLRTVEKQSLLRERAIQETNMRPINKNTDLITIQPSSSSLSITDTITQPQ